MSTPTRSPLAVHGEFPDAEVLVADILAVVEVNGVPLGVGRVDTDTSDLEPPVITCYAPPGRSSIGRYGDLETTFLYVDCVARQGDRDGAKAMADQVRRVLTALRRGGSHRGVQIHRVSEVTSPTELPLRHLEDPRHRESGWSIQLRRHRGETVHPVT